MNILPNIVFPIIFVRSPSFFRENESGRILSWAASSPGVLLSFLRQFLISVSRLLGTKYFSVFALFLPGNFGLSSSRNARESSLIDFKHNAYVLTVSCTPKTMLETG